METWVIEKIFYGSDDQLIRMLVSRHRFTEAKAKKRAKMLCSVANRVQYEARPETTEDER